MLYLSILGYMNGLMYGVSSYAYKQPRTKQAKRRSGVLLILSCLMAVFTSRVNKENKNIYC